MSTPTFLGLPPEIRRNIYLQHFRPVTLRDCGRWKSRSGRSETFQDTLAILNVCRHIYHEAAPLVLPNIRVFCDGNADVIDTLTKLGPERITQLRHLIVAHCPVGFNLLPDVRTEAITDYGNQDSDQSSDSSFYSDDGTRYFHLGAILGLFPGLHLDVLEVVCGVDETHLTGHQTADCFGSLLEADGYRRLRMEAAGGEGVPWPHMPSTKTWETSITTKFKPHSGWMIRIKLPNYLYPRHDNGYANYRFWTRAQNAGIELVEVSGDEEAVDHESEDAVDILVDRGAADIVVKPNDNRVLRCIERVCGEESQEFFKRTSDALRELFKNNSWETIKAMDGFDDGTADSWYKGDAAYANRIVRWE